MQVISLLRLIAEVLECGGVINELPTSSRAEDKDSCSQFLKESGLQLKMTL